MNVSEALNIVSQSIQKTEECDYFNIHQERYRIILQKIEELAQEQSLIILDIGCFPYHVGKALELLGHTVYGIASQHEPIKNKHIAIVNIEIEKFPFKTNFFDMVLCNEVVEHLPQSPIPALLEIRRVLKKNGICMVTTPNIVRSINRFKVLFGKQIMYPVSVFFENDGYGNLVYHRHNREYVLDELTDLIKKQGFKINHAGYFISYTPNRKKRFSDPLPISAVKWFNYCLMLMMPSMQDTLMVLGKKD